MTVDELKQAAIEYLAQSFTKSTELDPPHMVQAAISILMIQGDVAVVPADGGVTPIADARSPSPRDPNGGDRVKGISSFDAH